MCQAYSITLKKAWLLLLPKVLQQSIEQSLWILIFSFKSFANLFKYETFSTFQQNVKWSAANTFRMHCMLYIAIKLSESCCLFDWQSSRSCESTVWIPKAWRDIPLPRLWQIWLVTTQVEERYISTLKRFLKDCWETAQWLHCETSLCCVDTKYGECYWFLCVLLDAHTLTHTEFLNCGFVILITKVVSFVYNRPVLVWEFLHTKRWNLCLFLYKR